MKTNLLKTFTLTILITALTAGMILPANAATPAYGYYTAEEMQQHAAARQKALDKAIAEGKIPKGTTVDDCYFSSDTAGNIFVETKAEVAAEAATRKHVNNKPSAQAATTVKLLTGDEMKAYAWEVFELVNKERENAGMPMLDYDYSLQDAAMTRADECASVNSLRVNGKAHTRPDGSRWFTVLGIEKNYNYGENAAGNYRSPEALVAGWMESDGHRANILREDYTDTGIGVGQTSNGEFYWIQIFYRPL